MIYYFINDRVLLLSDFFKDSQVNSPHLQSKQARNSLLVKEYANEDFGKVF